MLKKHYIILLFFIIGVCTISCVSATDDVGDIFATNEEDIGNNLNSDDYETVEDDVVSLVSENNNEEILSSINDDAVLFKEKSEDVLSGYPVYSYQYSIEINDDYTISSTKGGSIYYYLSPYKMVYWDNYNFKFLVADNQQIVLQSVNYKSDANTATAGNYKHTFAANSLKPGTYTIAAVNNADNKIMSVKTLKVSGNAVITANDFNGVYNSGTMTARVTDTSGSPLGAMTLKAVFTKGKTSITKYYKTDSNGVISFIPPVGVGTWSVTFSSALAHVTASSVQKTAVVNKAPVKIKAYKAIEYKGFKLILKAKVTSNGKNVNEGTVAFKINGKTYKAAVKNGIATKKIKLKKVKTYKYTAKFTGNNFKSSKKVNAKAVLKKRLATKIIFKPHTVYSNVLSKIATVKIKTTSGKNVNGGKLKVVANGVTSYATVKKGKVKVILYGLGMKHFKGFKGNTEIYRKYIHKIAKLKYIPTSHKYKSSSKKVKLTSQFRCPACGKTSTHNHYSVGRYYVHTQVIKVV